MAYRVNWDCKHNYLVYQTSIGSAFKVLNKSILVYQNKCIKYENISLEFMPQRAMNTTGKPRSTSIRTLARV